MEGLKPCPYCGGHNIYVDGYDHAAGKRWRVVCLDCMATVDDGTTQQKYRAIEQWNLRVPDTTGINPARLSEICAAEREGRLRIEPDAREAMEKEATHAKAD